MSGSRAVAARDGDRLRRQIGDVLAHLRLPVQVTLAPLYLWGIFGAGGGWTRATVAGFVAIHVFLYGGTTLFNSYYDRDEGPIAGMERPRALPDWALPFSLAWQALGCLLALSVSAALGAFYAVYVVVGTLYSHPRWRLKAHPYASAALIFLFQGVGGFLAGWLAGSAGGSPAVSGGGSPGSWGLPSADMWGRFWLMALVSAGTTLALYPLTQVYQIEEDTARGDRTLAAVLGPARSFAFAVAALCLAAVAGLLALAAMGRPSAGLLLLCGYAVLIAAVVVIGQRFTRTPLLVNFRRLVALQFTAAAAFGAFALVQLAHPF